ncbi:MAG: hypothetical protein E2P02_00620 [Acidobacteria bacterium]|nr:MAG: hypothetical protein E2P02_00620 [Acidobacteriota bacterium]
MKLLDPGTRLDPKPREKDYQGHAVYELKVTYDEEVFIQPTAKAEVREVYRCGTTTNRLPLPRSGSASF